MRVDLEPAFILHRRPYRDTSLLIDAFTRGYGRIGLVARGARSPRARGRGLLEPMQPLRLSWRGRGELHTLAGTEAGGRLAWKGDGLYAGFYACELVLRVLARDDAHVALFDRFAALLETLAGAVDPGPALRLFERDLLADLGYALPLTAESTTGEAVSPAGSYLFNPRAGLRVDQGDKQSDDVAVGGAELLALDRGEVDDPAVAPALRRLLAAALAPHLGGRPLLTSRTLQSLRRFQSEES